MSGFICVMTAMTLQMSIVHEHVNTYVETAWAQLFLTSQQHTSTPDNLIEPESF